jgi:DNA-binding MarR family transcriptional regulator
MRGPRGTNTAAVLHRLVDRLDRAADRILTADFGVTYRRFYFLAVAAELDNPTQNEFARALSYSDASVSTMLTALAEGSYVTVEDDPVHGRRRRVQLTKKARTLLEKGQKRLDGELSRLFERARVDELAFGASARAVLALFVPAKEK